VALSCFAPAAEAKKNEVIERYDIVAMGTGHLGLAAGRAGRLELVVYRWTTPEERTEIIKTMGGDDGKAIRKYLEKLEVVGRIMIPGQPGYDLCYLWSVEQDGKHYVIGGSERALLSEPSMTTGDAKFYIGVVMLELDAAGEGTGTLAPAIEPVFQTNGTVKIESMVGDPIQLTTVTKQQGTKDK
jgi:hypothetical protein